ncbi:Pentapeptide repeat-containing protein [Actinomadura meyerae]|uniref:Pentapeptide repeat-containing protein n=1 Tax=Actinomadura meyerae TaxID=240840 RepID=A0A239M530_9ACTN|nr:pentapeptide repeat-containing protein [Actinomadura meyerae]SNT36989.1 Pentapeptide repeat-containing protein [Actinomadura meyerae]
MDRPEQAAAGSSGIRGRPWEPGAWPLDPEAVAALRGRTAVSTLYALDLDFRGADLTGADFIEAWLSGSDFSGCGLGRCVFWRAHCERANFRGADLARADFVKAFLSGADFAGARMHGVRLGRAECIRTSFAGADLRRADIGDATFIDCDMRNADLRESNVVLTGLGGTDFTNTLVRGMTGSVVGSIVLTDHGVADELEGIRLERWFRRNGADVSVLH